jgi:hypothetical protein
MDPNLQSQTWGRICCRSFVPWTRTVAGGISATELDWPLSVSPSFSLLFADWPLLLVWFSTGQSSAITGPLLPLWSSFLCYQLSCSTNVENQSRQGILLKRSLFETCNSNMKRQQKGFLLFAHQRNWATCMYSQKWGVTRVLAPIMTVPS